MVKYGIAFLIGCNSQVLVVLTMSTILVYDFDRPLILLKILLKIINPGQIFSGMKSLKSLKLIEER